MVSTAPVRHDAVPDRLREIKKRIPRPLKRAARSAARRAGLATASSRVLPDFLIIGTKRGGTTSLWNWLVHHPSVAPMYPASQQIKSPHYFDIHFDRGINWYRSHFTTESALLSRAAREGAAITGEASPYYMFHPLASARVRGTLPQVRIIVLLREPVARAYSNYWERVGSGAESLPTFEEAIGAESDRLRGETERIFADPRYYSFDHDCHSYLARGRYHEHLRSWLELFPRDNLLILPSEELYRDDAQAYAQIQRFLGVPVRQIPTMPHYNRLRVPPIAEETKARLREYYAPHNQALADLLGTDTPYWRY